MEIPDNLMTLLLGAIGVLTFTTGLFKWKSDQIKRDATRRTTTRNDTQENHKDINQLKEIIISLQSRISELCDRISRMEGAFNQHNRERDDNH